MSSLGRAVGWRGWATLPSGLARAEPGWLSIAAAHRYIAQQQYDDARAVLTGALAQARESGEIDLETFAVLLTARSLLLAGRLQEGLARMEDAMLRVTGGRTSPRMTSMLYCAAIGTCEEEAWELARAQEWARALERWMSSLPTLFGGAFLDNCRVYRAVLKRRRGQLAEARAELELAVSNLTEGNGVLVAGHACYELGEVHRLLGRGRRSRAGLSPGDLPRSERTARVGAAATPARQRVHRSPWAPSRRSGGDSGSGAWTPAAGGRDNRAGSG